MKKERKVVIITGASSGFGYNAAIMLAQKEYKVYALARRLELMEELKKYDITPICLDVTNDENCKKVVNDIIAKEGRIDILINNAGYGALGPVENVSIDDAKRQMDVNVYAVARLSKEVIPQMRNQHSGRIINVTSVAGLFALYYGGWYSASKYALEGLSDAMRLELKKFGIRVIKIEPAAFASNWGIIAKKSLEQYADESPYEDISVVAKLYEATFTKKGFIAKDPIIASKKIVKASIKKHPKTRYKFGRFSTSRLLMKYLLPTKLTDFFTTRLYSGKTAKKMIIKYEKKKNENK